MEQRSPQAHVDVSVQNIGGISSCDVRFDRGVTILAGRNATNRTSFLTALGDALGGSFDNLKSDRDEGSVTLKMDEKTYSRQFVRQGSRVTASGTPYCDQSELVDLFVAQLEDNPIRRAVERGDDLRELLMAPVDTEAIQDEIQTLQNQKLDAEERIQTIDRKLERLPELESRRETLEEQLEETEAAIEDLEMSIDELDSVDEEEVQHILDDLMELRKRLQSKQQDIETQRTSIDALREEREELTEEIESISEPTKDVAEIEAELSRLQDQERSLSETIATLTSVVEFNEDLLEGGDLELSDTKTSITLSLDPMSQRLECWTCGSEVPRRDIQENQDELRELLNRKRRERDQLKREIEALRDEADTVRTKSDRVEQLREERATIEDEIETREARIDRLQEEADQIQKELSDIESKVESDLPLQKYEVVDQYKELSEYEYQRGQLEQELCELETEIEDLEDLQAEQEELRAQKSEYEEELQSLRSRIETREKNIVETFNDRVEEVLSILGYENVERVWIERKVPNDDYSRANRRTQDTGSTFDLHIIRTNQDGAVYEDEINTLSESERRVVGLVVSLSGYLAHEVHEEIPMMLLDSLEAIDSQRIADLVDYLSEYSTYLVVALLPEDEQALDDAYTRIEADELAAVTE